MSEQQGAKAPPNPWKPVATALMTIAFIAGGAWCAVEGHPVAAGWLIFGAIVTA